MRKLALFIALLLVVAMPAVAAAQGKHGAATHAIEGVLKGTLTFVPYGPGLFEINSLGVATGQVKGLGKTTVFTFHRPTEDGTRVESGRFWLVSPSGDQIKGIYEGTTEPGPEPDQLIGRAEWVITGGTGRFANATGTISATAYVTVAGFDVFEWPVAWAIEGFVTY